MNLNEETYNIDAAQLIGAKPVAEVNLSFPTKHLEDFGKLIHDEKFLALQKFRDQITYIITNYPHIKKSQIAKFFQCSRSSISFQYSVIKRGKKDNGRPPTLPENVMLECCNYICKCAEMHNPATICDIQNFLETNYEIFILPDTLRKALKRQRSLVIRKVTPIEESRMHIDEVQLNEYFETLASLINHIPADFVINLDESGFQKYVDARKSYIVLPENIDINHFPVQRNEKRITLLGAITASGRTLKPLLILGRKTIDLELFECGFTPDIVDYAYSATGYMTEDIFIKWINRTLIPYYNAIRVKHSKENQAGVIIMDNCSAHSSEIINEILITNGIFCMPLIPHSSHLTQMLDVGIFGTAKVNQQRIRGNSTLSIQTNQILKMIGAWRASTHPYAITSSFRACGINLYFDETDNTLKVIVDGVSSRLPSSAQQTERNQMSKKRIDIDSLWKPSLLEGISIYQTESEDSQSSSEVDFDISNFATEEGIHFWNDISKKMDQIINEESSDDDDDEYNETPVNRRGMNSISLNNLLNTNSNMYETNNNCRLEINNMASNNNCGIGMNNNFFNNRCPLEINNIGTNNNCGIGMNHNILNNNCGLEINNMASNNNCGIGMNHNTFNNRCPLEINNIGTNNNC